MGQYVGVHGEVISHVNISRALVEDGGLYTCIAENRAGRADHSARLNIYGTLVLCIGVGEIDNIFGQINTKISSVNLSKIFCLDSRKFFSKT